MGGGSWTKSEYTTYCSTAGYSVDSNTGRMLSGDISAKQMFKQNSINSSLNPFNVIRECCDTEEHPNTIPVILALDVTGSMGSAAMEVAKALNPIMTDLYDSVKDIEFMIMGIGDLEYDDAPIQVSQFESDIRIAKWLDKIYFEAGGGGNSYESYTAAWWIGAKQTKLDCWKRGKKGIIITLGDEPLNPYLPISSLRNTVGNVFQNTNNIDTAELYNEVKEKYDVYHIAVNDSHTSYDHYANRINESFGKLLGNNLKVSTINGLSVTIANIIKESANKQNTKSSVSNEISW